MEQKLQGCIIRGRRGEFLFLSSDLPEALLLEILYRLPVKSVFRFKSVSKYWLSLISDPLFAQSYYSRKIMIPSTIEWTILYRYDCLYNLSQEDMWLHVLKCRHPIFKLPSFTLRFFSDDFNFKKPSFTIRYLQEDTSEDGKAPVMVMAVSNGLLLSAATLCWHDCYYICNPLTKQWSALPKPPRIHKWVSLGFIAEPIDGSFQVVRIGGYQGSSDVVNFEIFSSRTRQWKDKTASFNHPVHLFLSAQMYACFHAVPCNRILYLMEYDGRVIAYDTSSQTDDTEENDEMIRCRLIDLPGNSDISDKAETGTIGVCQDHLRYCHIADWSQNHNLRVWELRKSNNEEGEGDYWSLLYSMRFDGLYTSLSEPVRLVAFHAFHPDIVYLVHHRTALLTTLNLRTRVCRKLVTLKGVINWWTVFAFVLPPWPTPIPQISS